MISSSGLGELDGRLSALFWWVLYASFMLSLLSCQT